jgi:hypothetical protein
MHKIIISFIIYLFIYYFFPFYYPTKGFKIRSFLLKFVADKTLFVAGVLKFIPYP